MQKYRVIRYYSSFCTCDVQAEDEEQAYEKAQEIPIDVNELLENLEDWDDCDEVESV
ncbi:MAG: hypothetical protein R6U10_01485 [Thermoplasmatota archaeon]